MNITKRGDHKSRSYAGICTICRLNPTQESLKTSLCNAPMDTKYSLLLIQLPTPRHNTSLEVKFCCKTHTCTKKDKLLGQLHHSCFLWHGVNRVYNKTETYLSQAHANLSCEHTEAFGNMVTMIKPSSFTAYLCNHKLRHALCRSV